MNAAKSIAVLVTLCIIGPMLLGYVWPTSSEEVDQYEVSGGTDITAATSTDMVPIFSPYTGSFNNIFLSSVGWINGTELSVTSTYPTQVASSGTGNLPIYASATTTSSITMAADGILDIPSMTVAEGVVRVSFDFPEGFDIDGHGRADSLIWFPNTGQVVFNNSQAVNSGTVKSDAEIKAISAGTVERKDYTVNPNSYVNLDAGFWMPTASMQWYNGFLNSEAEILIHPNDVRNNLWEVSIKLWDGFLFLRVIDDVIEAAHGYDVSTAVFEELGGVSAYPNIRVGLNATEGLVTVEGLIGMDTSLGGFGFLSPSQTPGRTLEFEVRTSDGFTRLSIECPVAFGAAYMVSSTTSQIGTRPGIVNGSVPGDSYYPDGDWQLFIGDTAVFGDSITIGSTAFPVSRTGEITVTLIDGGTSTFRVRDLAIMSVLESGNDRRWFLNGTEIQASYGKSITFAGSWMCDLLIFDVDVVPQTIYNWEAGGFGLDVQGFCMAALMIDIVAFAALTLYGRNAGARVLPLLIACVIIGCVFFIFLADGIQGFA